MVASLMRMNVFGREQGVESQYGGGAPEEHDEFGAEEYPEVDVDESVDLAWRNFTTISWARPENDIRELLRTHDASGKPFKLNVVKKDIDLPGTYFDWLGDICKEYDAWWLQPYDRARRRQFLDAFNWKIGMNERWHHLAILMKLKTGIKRVFVMSRPGTHGLQASARYRILHLEPEKQVCKELCKPKTFKLRILSKDSRSWNRDEFCVLARWVLGEDDEEAENCFFQSLTNDEESLKYLHHMFRDTCKTVWKIFEPNTQLKFVLRPLRIPTVVLRPQPKMLRRVKCPDGYPPRDWNAVIRFLKSRASQSSELVDLFSADFFTGPKLARALMANALITAQTKLDTHLLHLTKDNYLYHSVFSHAQRISDHSTQVLVYDANTDRVSAFNFSGVGENSVMSSSQVRTLLETEVRRRRSQLYEIVDSRA